VEEGGPSKKWPTHRGNEKLRVKRESWSTKFPSRTQSSTAQKIYPTKSKEKTKEKNGRGKKRWLDVDIAIVKHVVGFRVFPSERRKKKHEEKEREKIQGVVKSCRQGSDQRKGLLNGGRGKRQSATKRGHVHPSSERQTTES